MKIFILTKRSIFLIFLVSNTFNPLLAMPIYEDSTKQTLQKSHITHRDIKDELTSKGLQEDTAALKADKLFMQNKNIPLKLSYLYSDKDLMLPKSKIVETLAKYALFERECDLSSYESLVGLVQNIKPNLTKKELAAIKNIADLS